METMSEHWIAKKIKEEGRLWVMKQNFWLFGTATYKDGSAIDVRTAECNSRRFFNALDRSVLARKELKEGNRLPRLVFVEKGRLRANTHIHFFIKGFDWKHLRIICDNAKQLWPQRIEQAANVIITDNFATNSDRAGYAWKEVWAYQRDALLLDCCHL